MAGLTWFELDVDFHDDPKVKDLVSRLRQPLADSYVSRLYAYCYKHATDRFPPASAADTIEDVCRWKGRRGVLFDALHSVEVLEREAGMVVVHGVRDRLAPHLAKRAADRIRIAEKRDKAAESMRRSADVAATSPRRSANVAGNRDRDIDKDKNQEASALGATAVRPIPVHLEGQCPDLAALLKRTAVAVSVGTKATLWGEADGIVRQVGPEAVEACWAAVAAKRDGESVPLAYLIHPMRDLVKRGGVPNGDVRVGVAAPASAVEHGKGGDRDITM